MTAPHNAGFTGIARLTVEAFSGEYAGPLPITGPYGPDRHFYSEGRRHADAIAETIVWSTAHSRTVDIGDLMTTVSAFPVDTTARRAYAEGVAVKLAHSSNLLSGIAALRERHLPISFITVHAPHIVVASDLPNEQCMAASDTLADVALAIAQHAGLDRPQLADRTQQVASAQENATATAHAQAAPHKPAAAGSSALRQRPGTAGVLHGTLGSSMTQGPTR